MQTIGDILLTRSAVETEPPARPVVYPLVPCCDTFTESLKGDMTFACLVTGYFPVPVDITWDISKGMQNVTQNFPPMKSSNGHLTSSSQLSILGTNVNGNRFQCNVAHNPTNTKTSKIVPTESLGQCKVEQPQISLLAPACGDGTITYPVELVCLLQHVKPNEAKVEWLKNGEKMNPSPGYSSAQGADGYYMGESRVNVSKDSWNRGDVYTCKVTHPAFATGFEMHNARKCADCCDPPPVEVLLLPPSLEDLYIAHNTTITCLVTNLGSTSSPEITWSRGSGNAKDVVTGKPVQQKNGTYSVTSILRVCAEEWKSGEKFTCTVKHPDIPSAIIKSISKIQEVNVQAPSVYVFPPSADELTLQESATLTCLAKGFHPSDILVTWTQQDRSMPPEAYMNVGPHQDPAQKGNSYFIYSKLTIPASEWQQGNVYSCVVGHEGLPMTFVHRSVDKASGKPTAVNVSVVLSDTEVTCY
ncbi:hypothetical protein Y1Q_0005951 [Alligator mississippiensis]|uniref:Ig-like domain-containing protein n=1 Tax=Alligator mississippiensis TaxID=8496 RepID=A0A151MYQ9_ALLMI|nr:hypothetical protein Y1Q_0005951 [Alligator mississippiensis]